MKGKLSAVEMAIGETMVNSKKAKRDLIDSTYNRYSTFENDSELPKWFVEDEEKNYRRDVVVPRQVLNDYRKKFEDINARPIKKVVEAQARKKRRVKKHKNQKCVLMNKNENTKT
jgi:AdoMet-dependent rRNA methyltransferase SPB1